MSDSTTYSSWFALVDSHLSKCSLQENEENTGDHNIPPLNSIPFGSMSESSISSKNLPPYTDGGKPIQIVLAEQVAKMLKAKEMKLREEERQKLEEEIKLLKIGDEKKSMIDLKQSIQAPYKPNLKTHPEEPLANSSSCEYLFKTNIQYDKDQPEHTKTAEPLLRCKTDMTYITSQKIRRSEGSSIGKVLSPRLRPVVAPYLRRHVPTSIVRFAFNTPLPCDIIRASLGKSTVSRTFTINI